MIFVETRLVVIRRGRVVNVREIDLGVVDSIPSIGGHGGMALDEVHFLV